MQNDSAGRLYGRLLDHLVDASSRLAAGARLHAGQDLDRIAAQSWSVVHGFVALELTDKPTAFSDPVVDVLIPRLEYGRQWT